MHMRMRKRAGTTVKKSLATITGEKLRTKANHRGADPDQDGFPGPGTSAPGSARLASRASISIRWRSALHPRDVLHGHRADKLLRLFWESTLACGPGFSWARTDDDHEAALEAPLSFRRIAHVGSESHTETS